MTDMISKEILPAVSGYAAELAQRVQAMSGLRTACRYEKKQCAEISELADQLMDAGDALEAAIAAMPEGTDEAMIYCRDVLLKDMTDARAIADQLEVKVDEKYWPFPTYSELLFSE